MNCISVQDLLKFTSIVEKNQIIIDSEVIKLFQLRKMTL